MAHFARSIAVKRLASRINIFSKEYVYFAKADLALVMDADFDHEYHLLSKNQKKPASEVTG
jgi:hypothetical protein